MGVRILRVDLAALMIGKNQQEHRAVVTHREAGHLFAGKAIADVDIFVSGPVTIHRKCGDHVSEIFLKSAIFSECQFSNNRMETIRPYHQVEISLRFALETNTYTMCALVDLRHAITENGFTATFNPSIKDPG